MLSITAGVFGAGRRARPLSSGEWEVGGKIYGMPHAVTFVDDYTGPPVVGEYVTHLPYLAALPAGNRTHDVRVDIVGQEIEIAPGIRNQAWTFGGSVPGPVLHVREGDRVSFTMKNRSQARVSVTEPAPGNTPFVAQLGAVNQQKALASPAPMHHSIDIHAATVAPDDWYRMIQPGESIRFAGPNDQSSSHIIGTVLDRVFYEGNPRNDWRGMQTVVLGASNGAVVEFIAPEAGDYMLVDHEVADAEKGAVGHIKVLSPTGESTRRITTMSH